MIFTNADLRYYSAGSSGENKRTVGRPKVYLSRSLTKTFARCNQVKGAGAKRAQEGAERRIKNHSSH